MTRKSNFREPKRVLIFNENRVLIATIKSLHCATQVTRINAQTISLCCTGQRISSNGFYFRHSDPGVKIDLDVDEDNLTLEEYDELCGVVREYHPVSEMKNRRIKAGRVNPQNKNIVKEGK